MKIFKSFIFGLCVFLLLAGALFGGYKGYQGFQSGKSQMAKHSAEIYEANDRIARLSGRLDQISKQIGELKGVSVNNPSRGPVQDEENKSTSFKSNEGPVKNCFKQYHLISNSDFSPAVPWFGMGDPSKNFSVDLSPFGIQASALQKAPDGTQSKILYSKHIENNRLTVTLVNPENLEEGFYVEDFDVMGTAKSGETCRLPVRISFSKHSGGISSGNYSLKKLFGRRGESVGKFELPYGTDFRSDNGHLLISDCEREIIQEFTPEGQLVSYFGGPGNRAREFNMPADVKFHDGKIYVIEEHNHRYQVFSPDGRFLDVRGAFMPVNNPNDPYEAKGYFYNPLGIALDNDHFIYVVDYANTRVQKFTNDGKFVEIFGNTHETGNLGFNGPYYIIYNKVNDLLYVTNRGKNEVVAFTRGGLLKYRFGDLDFPHELEYDKDGRIFVADTNHYRIAIFSPSGKLEEELVFPPTWGNPKTVAIRDNGDLYVGHVGGSESFISIWTKNKS